MMQERTTVEGSRRIPMPGATRVARIDPHERIEATIVVKRGVEAASEPRTGAPISRDDFAAAHGAHPVDIEVVARFAHDAGLTVVETDQSRRVVRVAGPTDAIKAAFGTELSYYDSPRGRYRGRIGALTLPADVAPLVDAVLGLDNRPIAKPHLRQHANPEAATKALWPTQVAKAYDFPTDVDGTGQTIAIIELGGGFRQADLDTYFRSLKILKPQVSAIGVLNGTNNPGVDGNSDGEVMLDIEVAGAVAPGAHIVVYFAPNTDQGFHDAITTAVHDSAHNPTVVSISWGGPESNWTPQAINVMNAALQDAAALGVTVTVAAGDDGSTDGVQDGADHVDFPASSPFALACGGTRLELTSAGAILSETVWNDLPDSGATGGGFSSVFPLPAYQSATNAAKGGKTRGVPDVAGNADPVTGYRVLVDGSPEVIGGTSAVAPLWAGLVALVNQRSHAAVGFWNPALYGQSAAGFHDITQGSNGTFKAGPGWDANTGIGTPDGKQLLVTGAGVITT
jgi:kumamolisin